MANTVKIESKNCKVIAHRGLSGLETENTCAAFVAAGNREKYFGIETDVHTTSDGQFVIIHDADLKRLADCDINVEYTPFDLSHSHKIKNYHGKAPRDDYHTPYLQDYLEICKKYDKHAILEVKTDMSLADIERMIDIIKDYDMLDNTVFISFTGTNLEKIRSLLPSQPIQLLTSVLNDNIIAYLEKYNFGLDIMFTALSEQQIELLKSKNIPINIWTCDSKEIAEKYINWGVDFLTTNILE